MAVNKTKVWSTFRDYFFVTLGMALYAFGFCGFILPERVIVGGVAGLGTIINFTIGLPVAISQFGLNLTLLALAWFVVGKRFVMGTIYGATIISLFIGIFQPLFAGGFTNDPFLNVVLGGMLCGMGIGMAFTHNGSSGGTDIVAAMVRKYSNVSVGRTMLYTDVTIISSSYLIFHELELVVYGYVFLMVSAAVTDMVINTNRQAVQFTIFSNKWQEIATAVNNEAHRGCTVLSGMGWYSKQDVKILLIMCRKIESVGISRIVKSIDPNAFITQANVNGVYGQGFDELKVKIKPTGDESETPSATLPQDREQK